MIEKENAESSVEYVSLYSDLKIGFFKCCFAQADCVFLALRVRGNWSWFACVCVEKAVYLGRQLKTCCSDVPIAAL